LTDIFITFTSTYALKHLAPGQSGENVPASL
jgi:hypothetical protein